MPLVVTRYSGQAVKVGDALVRVVRVDLDTGEVRISIDAPPEMPIVRDELGDWKPNVRKRKR